MSFVDNINQISANNRFNWDVNIDDRLVYVVIPGNSYSIKWDTGERDPENYFSNVITDNVWGLEGFKIAYFEAWAEKSLGIINPLELSIQKLISKVGGPNSLAGKIINKAWSACLECFHLHTYEVIDPMWIKIVDHDLNQPKIKNLDLKIEIKYNLYSGNLVIKGSVEYKIEEVKLAKFLEGLALEISGFILVDIDCLTGTINEFKLGIKIELSKTFKIAELLMKFTPTMPVGLGIKKYNEFAARFKWGLPQITAKIKISVYFSLSGGWNRKIGSFLDIEFGAAAALSIIFNMINIIVGFKFTAKWKQNNPTEWKLDLSLYGKLSIIINPRKIWNKWYIPNINVFKFVIRRQI
jgi:hypothetical protein